MVTIDEGRPPNVNSINPATLAPRLKSSPPDQQWTTNTGIDNGGTVGQSILDARRDTSTPEATKKTQIATGHVPPIANIKRSTNSNICCKSNRLLRQHKRHSPIHNPLEWIYCCCQHCWTVKEYSRALCQAVLEASKLQHWAGCSLHHCQ